jgi:DNA-binding NarL/FixJ family response regulator
LRSQKKEYLKINFIKIKKVSEEQPIEQNNSELSNLQKEIIRLIQQGSSSREISLVTGFSLDKINLERNSILKHTGCQSMYDVISRADKNNWLK